MEEKRFSRQEYPLDILAEFGLTEEMIYDLPDFVHEAIERGGKSPLLPISVEQPFGVTRGYAKFSLVETDEGIDVVFYPKLTYLRNAVGRRSRAVLHSETVRKQRAGYAFVVLRVLFKPIIA